MHRALLPALLILLAACSGDTTSTDTADGGPGDTATADGGATDGGADTADTPQVVPIDADTLAAWLEEEAAGERELLLINVHVPYAGEIPGTDAHVPYDDVDAIADAVGAVDRLVVLYCRSGSMSASASQALAERGYTAVHDLQNGMNGWEAAGYALDE